MTKKQLIREAFRTKVFRRAKYKCQGPLCSKRAVPIELLDAHHITDRTLMPNGGYIPENGIALCPDCHLKAEQWHITGKAYPYYEPESLYKIINSSYEQAVIASEKL